MSRVQGLIACAVVATVAIASEVVQAAENTDVTAAITTVTTDITDTFEAALPIVLAVAGTILVAFAVWKYAKRFIKSA